MKIFSILPILALSISVSHAAVVVSSFTIDLGAGTITDDSTGASFANIATSAGGLFGTDGLNLTTTVGTTSGTSTYSISITDPNYSLTSVVWSAAETNNGILGGTPTNVRVGIQIDTPGNLTTGIQNWTLAGNSITNGTPNAYLSNQQFLHNTGSFRTEADHWTLDPIAPSTSGVITYTRIAPNNQNASAANEFATVTFGFMAVPEPSSTALLGLAGLALIARRRR